MTLLYDLTRSLTELKNLKNHYLGFFFYINKRLTKFFNDFYGINYSFYNIFNYKYVYKIIDPSKHYENLDTNKTKRVESFDGYSCEQMI